VKRLLFVSVLIFSFFSAFADVGDRKFVSVPNVELRAKGSSFGEKVGKTAYGEEVVVVKESDSKKWSMVKKSNGISGWIPTTSLSRKKIVSKTAMNISPDELALAGKGFSDEDETAYRKSGSANYDAVDEMEKKSVSESELKNFLSAGNLNLE
jgi:uncharacterized protein YgiM (DUF1202 family)